MISAARALKESKAVIEAKSQEALSTIRHIVNMEIESAISRGILYVQVGRAVDVGVKEAMQIIENELLRLGYGVNVTTISFTVYMNISWGTNA